MSNPYMRLRRERLYLDGVPHFSIGLDLVPAAAGLDVDLPIREVLEGSIPDPDDPDGWYPRCPDCGGRIEWAENGGVPGSRRCAGDTVPDRHAAGGAASPPGVTSILGAGCGSRFVDLRYGIAGDVP